MQKIFFTPFFKAAASLSGSTLVLAASILVSQAIWNENFVPQYHSAAVSDGTTLYQMLPSSGGKKENGQDNIEKMNNENQKNANINDYSRIVLPSGTVYVKNASTGETVPMDIEAYTLGVLLGEMPQSFHMQALMAQAIAIRTFAVRCALVETDKHADADVCTDSRHCQSFVDVSRVSYDYTKAKQAVEATRGIILTCESQPILAAFHASSVGMTQSSADVWGGSLSYLIPVAAMEDPDVTKQEYSFSHADVCMLLELDEKEITFLSGTDGYVKYASDGTKTLSARNIQNALSLRSPTFTVTDGGDTYTVTCYGYGHGVGLSQHGADAMAENGADFFEILNHYYSGVTFTFVQDR